MNPDVELVASDGPPEEPGLGRSRSLSRLSKYGYIAGLAGTASVLVMGYLASRRGALDHGWGITATPHDQHLSMAFVLIVTAAVMFAVELAVRLRVDRGRFLSIPDELREGRYGPFLRECLVVYAVDLGLLALAFGFYRIAGEYGYRKAGEYYRPWFAIMDYVWAVYLWGGLPYVIVTRAFQHDKKADRKQAAFTVIKTVKLLAARFGPRRQDADLPAPLDRYDRSAMLGLLVKLFFVPVMTVFFADQFSHLVKNYDFTLNTLLAGPGTGRAPSVRDVYNISFTVIFSVDVGLAWCGYVLSSRWIKNTLFSVEPTVLGWLAALLSYPPINRMFGFYFSTPSESGFLSIETPQVVTLLAFFSVLSFSVYTAATVCFGLRFSNLTHRGIVTTGPYAVVRHPAYAAKNFSWWCVMLPYALYQAGTQRAAAPLLQVLGLFMMSGIYYVRAITEERHLRKDPEYRAYMERVPHRFIPGLI